MVKTTAHYHLPGLFEFFDFYRIFLPLYRAHPEYFYQWCDIASIYGSPSDCLWGGGRVGFGEADAHNVLDLLNEFEISARFTFSNSLLQKEHLEDKKCNKLCQLFHQSAKVKTGVIVHSDLLLDYLKKKYPDFYFVSSTTKVIQDFNQLKSELDRKEFSYVVPDFRFNNDFEKLNDLNQNQKDKMEFLCNECCWTGCNQRKKCYENVSRKNLGLKCPDHQCQAPGANKGYIFSKAMEKPEFIGPDQIQNLYLPNGFSNFKIEGRSLGSALLLEFILHYMTKPESQIKVREAVYLDSALDLF